MFLYTHAKSYCENFYEDLNDKNMCIEVTYKGDIKRDLILDNIYILYNIVFAFEIIIKIIAKGLILHKNAYFRSGWNILDSIITIYSFLELIFENLNMPQSLRVIRLMRVLKYSDSIPGISRLIQSIIISLPVLGNVLLFLGFVFIVFATLGIQIFSGAYYNRCRPSPVIKEILSNGLIQYISEPVYDKICPIGDHSSCGEGYFCVNFYNITNFFNMTNVTIDQFDVNDEKLSKNPYFNYGVPNFDNILTCLFNVFCFMTIQNWSEILTIMLDGISVIAARAYFFAIVTIGGFFIMKLILAAQNEALIKVRKDEKAEKLQLLENLIYKYPHLFNKRMDELWEDVQNIKNKDLIENIENLHKELLKFEKKKSQAGFDLQVNALSFKELKNTKFGAELALFKNKNKNLFKSSALSEIDKIQSDSSNSSSSGSKSNDSNKSDTQEQKQDSKTGINKEEIQASNLEILKSENGQSDIGKVQMLSKEKSSSFKSGNHDIENNLFNYKLGKNENNKRPKNKNISYEPLIEFSHSCKQIKEKISFLKSKGEKIDPIFNLETVQIFQDNIKLAQETKQKLYHSNLSGNSRSDFVKSVATLVSTKLENVKNMTINKLKFLILEKYSNTPGYIIFNVFMYLLTLVNLLFLFTLSYPIKDDAVKRVNFINILCSSLYLLEIFFRLLVLGWKGYFRDKSNITDLVVVLLGVIEILTINLNSDPDGKFYFLLFYF
jgi:hypothetical protein